MTRDEAISVISTIMAAWPQAKAMSDETAELWIYDLEPLDAQTAVAALDKLRFRLDFPPTTAQFTAAYQDLLPRQPIPTHQKRELPPKAEELRDRDLENIRRIRAELSKIGKKWPRPYPTKETSR